MPNRAFRQAVSKSLIGGVFLSFTVLIMLVALPVITVQAATINVNTTEDEIVNDGDCSLREAIISANNDVARDACTAGEAGGDTINLPPGTYTLTIPPGATDVTTSGDLDISGILTIQGGGADVTVISGGAAFGDRIFDIRAGATVTINDVTVTGGDVVDRNEDGGGIENNGTLTLDGVAVDNNTAVNAGGIINTGGGILTIQNSTISNNTATNDAGGIQNGISLNPGDMEIINSTISGNTAASDVGGINNRGTLALNNVTITENTATSDRGGGIFNHPDLLVELSNTILAGNNAGTAGPDCFTQDGSDLTSLGFNLVGNNADCTFNNLGSDQVGTGLSPIDPMLGPLQNNGGTTETHLPQEGSPVLDMGSNDAINGAVEPSQAGSGPACEATDQRGQPRPADGDGDETAVCDIGAVELQEGEVEPSPSPTPTPTVTPTPTPDDNDDDNGCNSIAGNVSTGQAMANVLILLVPVFAIGFRMLRKGAGKNRSK